MTRNSIRRKSVGGLCLRRLGFCVVLVIYSYQFQGHMLNKYKALSKEHTHDKYKSPVSVTSEDNIIKYHQWGSEGIDIEAIITFFENRLFNYWGYKTEQHLNSLDRFDGRHLFKRQEASYLAVIAVGKNETTPNIFISPRLIIYSTSTGNRLLPDVLPMMKEALSIDLLKSHNRKKYPHLISALEEGSIPLIFQTSDWIWCTNQTNGYVDHNGDNKENRFTSVPRLTWAKLKDCGYNFALPDYKTIEFAKKREEQDFLEEEKNQYPPWEDKKPQAVWRGQISNPDREEMINRYQNHTNFDVANVDWSSMEGEYMPQQDSMNYRAVLDIDGRSWSDRFQRLLCQTSVVIKIQLKATSYFDAALTPGVHYLAASLENLTDVVEYATSDNNAEEMKGIIANANQWCDAHVVYGELKKDILSILDGYVEELYRGNSDWTDTWNQQSPEFLTGEKAWNETNGWMPTPDWEEFWRAYKREEYPVADDLDLVVMRLPKEQT